MRANIAALWLLVAAPLAMAQQPAAFDLTLVDMKGRTQVLGTLPPSVFAPRISPDGLRVAFELADADAGTTRVYVAELAHLDQRRALPMVGTGRNWAPVWYPDGRKLVFLVNGDRPDALFVGNADGSGEAAHLIDGRAAEGVYDDGRRIAFITLTGERDYGISLLDTSTKAVTPLADRPDTEEHSSRISPDGRWVAYASAETGRQEVWLAPVPADGRRFQVTREGGSHPLWSPDMKSLYFDRAGQMFRIPVFTGAQSPKIGDARALPIRGFQQGDRRRQFDLMPDGRRFLLLMPRKAEGT